MSERPFLIWSTLHGAWWRPKAQGYCVNIADAGIFANRDVEASRDRKVYLDQVAAEISIEISIYQRKIEALGAVRDALSAPAHVAAEGVAA